MDKLMFDTMWKNMTKGGKKSCKVSKVILEVSFFTDYESVDSKLSNDASYI